MAARIPFVSHLDQLHGAPESLALLPAAALVPCVHHDIRPVRAPAPRRR